MNGARLRTAKVPLLLAAALGVATTPAVAGRAVQASVRGDSVFIREAGRPHRLKLPEEVKLDADQVSLISQREVGGARYLLLYLTGPSRRSKNGMGHCGAGVESGVIWFKLQGWQIVEHRYRQVESCWRDISLLAPAKWVDGIYVVDFWDPNDNNQEFTLRYDTARVAEGYQLTSEPFH